MQPYIGLMSGTSLDGVDGVLVGFEPRTDAPLALQVFATHHVEFEPSLRDELLALNTPADGELHRAALAANALTRAYVRVVDHLLATAGMQPAQVKAIGAHGQTVRHRPQEFDGTGYTLQLANGALLAEHTGIDVVCDLRSRDVAAGGQGAPLVPAFHAALFASKTGDAAVLNLGGIANLTLLPLTGPVLGFDCGPANALLDAWCRQHRGSHYDDGGQWAATGQVDADLLRELLYEPYFRRAPPKSTGRDLFNPAWLQAALQRSARPLPAQDVQATLTELTVQCVARALAAHAPNCPELLVCGGGAFNTFLMQRLAAVMPDTRVQSTMARGVPPDQVEALAFAWLARAHVQREPANLPSATGAAGPRVLGALYPA